jgi:hypothetical protein
MTTRRDKPNQKTAKARAVKVNLAEIENLFHDNVPISLILLCLWAVGACDRLPGCITGGIYPPSLCYSPRALRGFFLVSIILLTSLFSFLFFFNGF